VSWSYAGHDVGMALFDACLRAGAPMTFTSGMRVLDLGCAECDWLERARAAWPEVAFVGVDQRSPRKPRDGVIKGDVLQLDLFPPETFDAIVSLSAIEHIGLGHYQDPRDPDGDTIAMRNAYRWLKPGGWMYFDVPYDPTGYRVQGTKCRVYDDAAVVSRLLTTLPIVDRSRPDVWVRASVHQYFAEHARPGHVIPRPTHAVQPFHYVAMVWKKPCSPETRT